MKTPQFETLTLSKIVGGGQSLGTLKDGRKCFVWGGLPGETVKIRITKKKSNLVEGVVTEVLTPSPERVAPKDPASYLSTSPWQIMDFTAEQHYKAALILEAFELSKVTLPNPIEIYTNNQQYGYRNKVEFSWYGSTLEGGPEEQLDLAFFVRGGKGKVPVSDCSLLPLGILALATEIRDFLQNAGVNARQLKTLLIRCDQQGNCAWQLYIKDAINEFMSETEASGFSAQGGEIIYSDPRSPASRITKRLLRVGNPVLTDTILGVPFSYATEGFFQVNIPVYEQALRDMKEWVTKKPVVSSMQYVAEVRNGAIQPVGPAPSRPLPLPPALKPGLAEVPGSSLGSVLRKSAEVTAEQRSLPSVIDKRVTVGGAAPASEEIFDFSEEGADRTAGPAASDLRACKAGNDRSGKSYHVLDLYSGVGSIGLTIGGDSPELVEINEDAVREMKRNIKALGSSAKAILAPSEKALDYITSDKTIIVDPPRAGLHKDVVERLLETKPRRIIYLSCNPVTQARDIALLCPTYRVIHHRGYNFFPRTPHIEHLIVLDLAA